MNHMNQRLLIIALFANLVVVSGVYAQVDPVILDCREFTSQSNDPPNVNGEIVKIIPNKGIVYWSDRNRPYSGEGRGWKDYESAISSGDICHGIGQMTYEFTDDAYVARCEAQKSAGHFMSKIKINRLDGSYLHDMTHLDKRGVKKLFWLGVCHQTENPERLSPPAPPPTPKPKF